MSDTVAAQSHSESASRGSDESNRRRRPRVVGQTLGYLLPESPAPAPEPASAPEPWEIRIHDVSRQGVGFISTESMKQGDLCRIRIGQGPMRLARLMRVKHCRHEGTNLYHIGAEFA